MSEIEALKNKMAKLLLDTPASEKEVYTEHPFTIGQKYMIRTVTMIQLGRLQGVYPTELVITDASWVAETGIFGEFLKEGACSKLEYFPDGKVVIGRGAIIEACEWLHELPRPK